MTLIGDRPNKGDEVTNEYTDNLYDPSVGPEKDFRGKQIKQAGSESRACCRTIPKTVVYIDSIDLVEKAAHLLIKKLTSVGALTGWVEPQIPLESSNTDGLCRSRCSILPEKNERFQRPLDTAIPSSSSP